MNIWNPGFTKFTYFWREFDVNGEFSQWWTNNPITLNGIEYNCTEQYMMASKAREFNDKEIEQLILQTTNPKLQKALGRKIGNFNKEKWNSVCKNYVRTANIAKFSQHPELLEKLLATKGTLLVEASPHDQIWGLGIHAEDAKAGIPWNGTNWLGEVLTQIRDEQWK